MIDVKEIVNKAEKIRQVLERGNNVEIRQNAKGEIKIFEIVKKNIQ